jgi:cell pole-organizing protein PopZ
MMTDAKTDQEPTMEEILASIRRIISEDDPEDAAPVAEVSVDEMPGPQEDTPADDVLELTEVAEEPEPEPEVEAESGPDLEFGEDEAEPAPDLPMEEDVTAVEDDDRLVSDVAASATASAFAGLSAALGSTRIEGRTMEDIVKELLRPMLKDWLDTNLPSLVEQIVREEVERLSRRR